MGKTENTAKLTRCKPAKIVAIATAIAMVVFLAVSIVFGCLLPKSDRLDDPVDGGRYTSMITREDGTWYYTTSNGTVCQMSAEDEMIERFDLKSAASENYNLEDCGSLMTIHAETGSPYIYVASRKQENYWLFQLQEVEGKLTVQAAAPMSGRVAGIQEADGEVYVLISQGSIYKIDKFDAENIEDGTTASGYLYNIVPTMPTWKLLLVKNPGVLSFDIIDGFVYIVHTGGIIRMSSDFTMNKWEEQLPAEIDEVYETLANATVGEGTRFASEYQKEWDKNYQTELDSLKKKSGKEEFTADELAALEAQAAANTDAKKTTLELNAKTVIRNEATAEVLLRPEYEDVEEYNESEGSVTLRVGPKELYPQYAYISGYSFRGAAYHAEKDRYYFLSNDYGVYTCTMADIQTTVDALASFEEGNLNLQTVASLEMEERPAAQGTAFYYDERLSVGYVLHDASDYVTCIDLNEEEIVFRSKMDFDIKSIQQNANGNRIYYFYLNANEADSGNMILRAVDITNQAQEVIYRPIMTVGIVLCVLSALVCLVAFGCMRSEKFLAYVIDVARGFKKHWGIYLILGCSLVLLSLFCYYPAVGSISLSFYDYTSERPTRLWNNFYNYKYVFTNPYAWEDFRNMFFFLLMDLLTALAPPLIFAFCLTIMKNKGYSGLMRTLLFIPGIIPGVATTLIWKTGIFGAGGVLNTVFGSQIEFFSPGTAIWSLVLMGFPYVGSYLIFYGAMMNVPDSYYEAAELDGITVMKRFIFIDIPLIFPQIKYVVIMTFIASVQNYGRTYMVTGGSVGDRTPIFEMYELINSGGDYGKASAYATILFIFLFGATVLNLRKKKKELEV